MKRIHSFFLVLTAVAGITLTISASIYSYRAGVAAGTDKGKAEVYEKIMGGAVYNLGALKEHGSKG
ncbi:MAG: hypothetical protein J0H19_24045 [Rhodospirillales bacterium]|nr:hypothetical protein [Rhodospirillales bacterium]